MEGREEEVGERLTGGEGEGASLPKGPFSITSDSGASTIVSVLAEVLAVVRKPQRYGHVAEGLAVSGPGGDLEIVREGFRGAGVRLSIQPVLLVQHLFFGMTVDPMGQRVPRGLQPWQMPRLTWEALWSSGSVAFGVVPGANASGDAVRWIEDAFRNHFGYGHNGPPYGVRRDTNARYEVQVAYALACGKDVPAAYVEDARRDFGKLDLHWAAALVDRPALRGKVQPEQWQTLHAVVERWSGITLTAENAQPYFDVVSRLGADPNAIDLDDALFEAGLLPALQPMTGVEKNTAELGTDDQVDGLITRIGEYRERLRRAALQKEREAGRLSLRELKKRLAEVGCETTAADMERAKKIVAALRERSIDVLSEVLDTADETNVASKAFANSEFGLQTSRLRAADRRRAIFAYCGMDEAAQAEWEDRRDKQRRERQAAREEQWRAEQATRKVSTTSVRTADGLVTTWKQLIDQRIATGFSEIRARPRGAVTTYWLANPTTGEMLGLKAGDGTLDYAKAALAEAEENGRESARRAA